VSTGRYAATAELAVTQSLGHVFAARLVDPAGSFASVPLVVEGGSITFDEGFAPGIVGTLECPLPVLEDGTLDTVLYERCSGRRGYYVEIDAGYVYPSGVTDLQRLATLVLRERTLSRNGADASMVLSLSSLEVHAYDVDTSGTPTWNFAGLGLVTPNLRDLLDNFLTPEGMSTPFTDLRADPANPIGEVGDFDAPTPGHVMEAIAKLLEARLYPDDFGGIALADRVDAPAATSAAILSTGAGGTVTGYDDADTLDGWATDVEVSWTGSPGLKGYASRPDLGILPPWWPQKTLKVELPGKAPATVWRNAVAQRILRRALSQGVRAVVSAPAAWWLRPTDTVTLDLAPTPQRRDVIRTVTFDLADGAMTLVTRRPDANITA